MQCLYFAVAAEVLDCFFLAGNGQAWQLLTGIVAGLLIPLFIGTTIIVIVNFAMTFLSFFELC